MGGPPSAPIHCLYSMGCMGKILEDLSSVRRQASPALALQKSSLLDHLTELYIIKRNFIGPNDLVLSGL